MSSNNTDYFINQSTADVYETPDFASVVKESLKKRDRFRVIDVVKDQNGKKWIEIQRKSVNIGFINSETNITSTSRTSEIWQSIGYSFILWFVCEVIEIINTSNAPDGGRGSSPLECLFALFFGFLIALQASKKGFEPIAWIVAGGFIGLIVISSLPSVNEDGIDGNTRKKRAKSGNVTGMIISFISILIVVIILSSKGSRN